MKARFVFENGKEEIRELSLKKGEVGEVSIAREDVPEGVDYIDFAFDFLSAKAGEKLLICCSFKLPFINAQNKHANFCFAFLTYFLTCA